MRLRSKIYIQSEKTMLYFKNDYSEGACREVMEALLRTNDEHLAGYGADIYTERAKEKIRKSIGKSEAEIYFITGGTQTNKLLIDTYLDSAEGVISVETGHIAVHEGGAIEATGHKVLTIPHKEGKLTARALDTYMTAFLNDAANSFMVQPGMVYITHPTEYGTLYTRSELTDLSEIAHKYNLPLFMDGARLGYALACPESDLTLPDIAELCDAFYIGGTKVGALCGEALIYTNAQPQYMQTKIKQHGALLAKGRLNGVQFDTLFTDDLYIKIADNAIKTATVLREALLDKGYKLFIDSPTNQLFPILSNDKLKALSEKVVFEWWEPYDEEHSVIRFATSFATKMCDVEELIELL